MIDFEQVKTKAKDLFSDASFLGHINNEEEYQSALELMDELIEEYDTYRPLIEILSASIERWEDQADEFQEFNARIAVLGDGVAALKTLMDQHQLKADDLKNEIGGKSLVSMILSGKRNLTLDHINALASRFNVSPVVFLSTTAH